MHAEFKIEMDNILSQGLSETTRNSLLPSLFNIVLEKLIRESHAKDSIIQ